MNTFITSILLVLSVGFLSNLNYASEAGQLELSPLFKNHMVLQRGKDIRIDGRANAQSIVKIRHKGSTVKVTADESGRWAALLPAQKAGGPYTIAVSTENDSKTIKDIYYGDVWLASGQSNMEYKLRWDIDHWQVEALDSHYPRIRYFKLPRSFSNKEEHSIENAQWVIASPQTSPDFSAIAWFFAKRAHLEKNIPIGIVDSTWGGTPAEAWSPKATLLNNPSYAKEARAIDPDSRELSQEYQLERQRILQKTQVVEKNTDALAQEITRNHLNTPLWQTESFPNNKRYNDVLWLRKEFSLNNVELKKAGMVTLELGKRPRFIKIYLNGKLVGEKTGRQKQRDFSIASKHFKAGKNILVIRAISTWDNDIEFGKKDSLYFDFAGQKVSLEGPWQRSNQVEAALPMPQGHWMKPTVLYNAMIAPLTGYPLKGIIWYQGESNTSKPHLYARLFKDLINSWREQWQQTALPFLFVQLASFRPQQEVPQESHWAELREAQTDALSLPDTGMAVAIDAGDALDVHPRNKQIIGQRLWQAAKVVAYRDPGLSSGPQFERAEAIDNTMRLSFKHTGSGLTHQYELKSFELAGSDKKYVKAKAEINGQTITVWSNKVKSPIWVRYGWADNSPANLYNKEGLPAVPFRYEP